MRLFCYYFVTRIRWSNKTNSYICIGWKSHATLTPLAKQDCPPLATI